MLDVEELCGVFKKPRILLFRETAVFGATAKVLQGDGTVIWRNRMVDPSSSTIEAALEDYDSLLEFETMCFVKRSKNTFVMSQPTQENT